MKKILFILAIILMNTIAASAQELHLVVHEKPLNDVLRSLPIELSFDDNALSKYKITINKKFDNAENALAFLLKDKPFQYEKISSVYVISPYVQTVKTAPVIEKKYYTYTGSITDADSGESLPYAYITTPEGIISTDETGYFIFKTQSQGTLKIAAQYLGYEKQDTVLTTGFNTISLHPLTYTMDEVVINSSPSTMLIQSGGNPGEIRINHQVAKYIPGSIDNSVFNLMRMMPGVRASGEPSEDLIVWGSNTGDSKITYDGYTLFGIKNYNDHIGSVNPYMVKDIRIMKGGYSANQGERIGAIAEITGIDGNFNAPSVKANVSNYTANLFASVPLSKNINVSAAYRQTFYNLYNNTGVELPKNDNGSSALSFSDIYIKPKYNFRDANFKLSGKAFNEDSYYITLYGADDRFKFSVKQPDEYDVNAAEKNRQYGGAASYKRVWKDGSSTKFLATFSRLISLLDNLTIVGDRKPTSADVSHLDNVVQEFSIKLNHDFYIGSRNKIQVGGEWQQYRVSLNELCGELDKPSFYVNDNILLGKLSLNAGLRLDIPLNKKAYLQPRLSGRYKISEKFAATASWGMYNQFLTRTAFKYDESGIQTVWSMADSTFTKAVHTTAGIAYNNDGLLISLEGYHKRTKNGQYFLDNTIYRIHNTILGADLFAKKQLNNHTIYGSYSINNIRKPQNELSHEIKVGGIGAFDPFYFSLSYVYGTGFAYISTGGHGHGQGNEEGEHSDGHEHSDSSNESYSRFDIGATYRTHIKKVRLQAGVSLLNVFGTKNIKYNYQVSGQNSATNIFTKATPFTPTVFLEIVF